MNDSLYGLLCAILLGLGQMCMFTGYDTQSFIVEPALRSVHDRSPDAIDAHAGYYGQAVSMMGYTLMNLIAPWVLGSLGSKLTLVVGSSLITLYLATFLSVHYISFYLTAALMGCGFALFYSGNGGYLTEHSSRETIERNSALTWGIGTSCMIVGGIVMLFTIQPPASTDLSIDRDVLSINSTTLSIDQEMSSFSDKSYRQYSDREIRLMYGAFALISLCSNILFAVIPKRAVKDSIAEVGKRSARIGFVEQLGKIFGALINKRVLEITPFFIFTGNTMGFWLSVYPTTLIFTKKLSSCVYLPAFYSILFGCGDLIMGILISLISKRVRNFALMPSLIIGSALYLIALVLILLSTPAWSTTTPNDEPTLLLEPSFTISIIVALLFGLSDNCINTTRTVLCTLSVPDQRSQLFSISKFYQSLTASVLMFLSAWLSVPMYFAIIVVNGIVALAMARGSIDRILHEETSKTSQQSTSS